MKLNKPTEEELKQMDAKLTPGYAKFFVKEAKFKISKIGNEQIELKLSITDVLQVNKTLWVYLVNHPQMMWKIKHFCEQAGLTKEFETGELEDYMCLNKEGICILKLEKQKDKEERIVVNDFAQTDTKIEKFDDEIPF